ncbi:MAG TPA: hypothetical protein VNO25_05150, partial [Streptosporangiaceae bacterium]|nr:hypothetical protein [Streptosporangiaceae bacterium]
MGRAARQLGQRLAQGVGVGERVQGGHLVGGQRRHRDLGDERVIRSLIGLPPAEPVFGQLLAWTEPGEDDLGLAAADGGQPSRHVGDPDGFAHVEDEDLSGPA